MSKIKIAIAALSLVTAGGLMTACDDGPKARHNTIDEGAPLGSGEPAEAGETEAERLARIQKERQERMDAIASKLNYAINKSYDENKCSSSDLSELLSKITFKTNVNESGAISTKERSIYNLSGSVFQMNTAGLNVKDLRIVLEKVVKALSSEQNLYCSINAASITAKHGKEKLASFGRDQQTTEEGKAIIEKAEVIANAIAPLVSDLMNKIHSQETAEEFRMNVKVLAEVSSEVSNKSSEIESKVEEVRSRFKCSDDQPDCSGREKAQGSVNVRSLKMAGDAKTAVKTYGSESISGPGDASLGAKIEVLEKINAELQSQLDVLDRIIAYQKKLESQAAAAEYSANMQDFSMWATPVSQEEIDATRARMEEEERARAEAEKEASNIHYRNNGK